MTTGLIVSLIFVFIAVAFILFLLLGKAPLCRNDFRKYSIASSIVYLSATILIAIVCLIVKDLTASFAVVGDISITVFFVIGVATVNIMGKNMNDMRKDLKKDEKREEDN